MFSDNDKSKLKGPICMRFRKLHSKYLIIPAVCSLVAGPAAASQPTESDSEITRGHATTSPEEAKRVDSVDVSGLAWGDCPTPGNPESQEITSNATFSCATLDVPMNYAKPEDGSYTLFIKRRHANNPDKKQASLFVNPGGPGGAASSLVDAAERTLPQKVLDSFDIVGVDPRGVSGSPIAECITDKKKAAQVDAATSNPPRTPESRAKFREASKYWAEQCARPGNPVANHGSTANVARDMDVVRRAVGDDKLSYLGFSYGTVLGQQYANLFPDRFRVLAIDGVVDAASWAGALGNSQTNLFHRAGSAAASERALRELLKRCEQVGSEKCDLASSDERNQTAQQAFMSVRKRLQDKPIEIDLSLLPGGDEGLPDEAGLLDDKIVIDEHTLTMISNLSLRNNALSPEDIPTITALLRAVLDIRDIIGDEELPIEAQNNLKQVVTLLTPALTSDVEVQGMSIDTLGIVWCSDGSYPTLDKGIDQAINSTSKYPVFGQQWGIAAVKCGSDNWKAKKIGAYTGPFYKRTAAAPLIVGNLWDPATNHDQAAQLTRRTPNAHFLSSDSWGHIASGTSTCVDDIVSEYLISGKAPRRAKCTGDYQPFTDSVETAQRKHLTSVIQPFGVGTPQDLRNSMTEN